RLDVDRHRLSVICVGVTAGDVVGRATALILVVAEVEQPVGDVDPIGWHVDYVLEAGLRKDSVGVRHGEFRWRNRWVVAISQLDSAEAISRELCTGLCISPG